MTCKHCGKESSGAYCKHCNAPLFIDPNRQQYQNQRQYQNQQPYYNQQYPQQQYPNQQPYQSQPPYYPQQPPLQQQYSYPPQQPYGQQPHPQQPPLQQQYSYPPQQPYGQQPHPQQPNGQPAGEYLTARDKKLAMAKQKKQRKAHISFGRVFFPALALLLPLIYLFTDAFILYSEALFVGGEGETLLARLIAQLSDAAFAANPVFDLIGVTYGGAEPLFEILTVFDVLSAGGEYASLLAPAWLICLTAVFSALCAVLILFTAGRILRVRAVADAVVIGGSLAAMAPFLADLSFRIYHVINGGFEAADLAIGQFSLSVELMLTLALSLCVVLPAVRALRRAAGGDGVYVTFPYRVASKLPTLARLLSLVLGAVAAVIPFVLFVVPACSAGTLYDALSNALGYFGDDFLSRIDLFGGTPIAVVADAVAALLHLALLIFMLLALVRAALRVLRVFFTGAHRVAVKKRVRRKFTRAGGVWRKPALHVLRCYIAIAVVAVLLTLFGTPMRAHVDFASVSDTLTLVYLVIAWAKAYCKLLSAGVMLCALSLALATVAGNLSRAFVSRAIEDHREENE